MPLSSQPLAHLTVNEQLGYIQPQLAHQLPSSPHTQPSPFIEQLPIGPVIVGQLTLPIHPFLLPL
jgi:hypothetical protein